MYNIVLTQNSTFILGPVAKLLGFLMEGIFWVLDKIGIPNIGIAIILFTIVIYLLLLPLTIKQQKFAKLSAIMNPEIQAIQAKYKGRQDTESMQAMNMETQAVYAKYGVSPTGSCLQLLIQMPILLALYRVIYAIPAYVTKVKEAFFPMVDELIAQNGSKDFIQSLSSSPAFNKQFKNELFTAGDTTYVQNTFVDVLNRASNADWNLLIEKYPNLSESISASLEQLDKYNEFFFINIAYSPWETIMREWGSDERSWIVIIFAVLIPFLAAATQWIGLKLAPTANTNNDKGEENPMMASMKTMNNVMPIMSAVFCFTLPAGMGLYWIAGAVIRAIQQVAINKFIDHNLDVEKLMEKNSEKFQKKMEKRSELMKGLNERAMSNTRSIDPAKNPKAARTQEQIQEDIRKATEYYNKASKNAPAGSLASKANMVKNYNERNNK